MFELFAMDVPLAPVDGSNVTFAIWAITVLMLALGAVVMALVYKVRQNETKCEADRKKCEEAASGYHKRIEGLLGETIQEQAARASQNTLLLAANQKVLERTADVQERTLSVIKLNNDIIAVLGKTDQRRHE